jgi:hypothetical protein
LNEIKQRHTYYLRGLAPAFLVMLLTSFLSFSLLGISTFLMCYLWPYFLFTPGAYKRFSDYKYRWSFVGMLVRTHKVIEDGLPFEGLRFRLALSLIVPVVLSLLLWGVTGAGEPLYALAGAALFALVYRYLLHSIVSAVVLDESETAQATLNAESSSEPSAPVQNHQTDNDLNS